METIEMTIFESKLEKKFSIVECHNSQSHIFIRDIIKEQGNILLKIDHEEEYSYLDFTGCPDYKLIYLTKNNEIFGGTYAVNSGKSNIIKTGFNKILLVTLQTFIDENENQERSMTKGRELLKELKAMGPCNKDVGKTFVIFKSKWKYKK